MSFHGFPWFSLTILLYHSLLPAGFLDYIPWPVVVDKFLLVVQHLHICVNRSIVERRLWVLLYFSSSVSRVLPWLSLKLYIYIYIYIYIYKYIYISCRFTDFPDSHSPFFSIIHHFRQVFLTTYHDRLLLISSCWSSNTCTSVLIDP